MIDYEEIIRHAEKLRWCALVQTGRSGSDYLQSLFDGHEEVFVFNGQLLFSAFWPDEPDIFSISEFASIRVEPIDIDDLTREIVGRLIYRLKSKYDIFERKNKLGFTMDQSLSIDVDLFSEHVKNLLRTREVNRRNTLRAIYIAYAMCLEQDILVKKLFLHHIHHIRLLPPFLKDFPDGIIVATTREPRATIVSSMKELDVIPDNPGKEYKQDNPSAVYKFLYRVIENAHRLKVFGNEFCLMRLETFDNRELMEKFCKWIGISYSESLEESTWGGLYWWGDLLSVIPEKDAKGRPKKIKSTSKWKNALKIREKIVLNYILQSRLINHEYPHRAPVPFIESILVFILILIPLQYEWRYINPIRYLAKPLISSRSRLLYQALKMYVKRLRLYFKYYFKELKGIQDDLNVIKL